MARAWGCPWQDTDALVSSRLPQGDTVRSFYQRAGRDAFEDLEYQAVKDALEECREPGVWSTGGGLCDNPRLSSLLASRGILVYLRCPEEILWKRIERRGIPPFLDPEDPRASFHALYARRDALYDRLCPLVVQLPFKPDAEGNALYVRQRVEAFDGAQQLGH